MSAINSQQFTRNLASIAKPKLREMSLTKCLVHCEEKFGFDLLQFHYACDSMTVFLVRNSDINKIIRQIIQAFWGYRQAFLAGDLAHKTY